MGEFTATIDGNEIALFHDGDRYLDSMLAAIAGAKSRILLEMYWFGSDHTGTEFARALSQRAQEGLEVFLLYDAIGSWDTKAALFDEMKQAGCLVRQYNPIVFWHRRFRVDHVHLRNHRKMLIVDSNIAFTGGLNITEESRSRERGGAAWRDDAVSVRGPVVHTLESLFWGDWSVPSFIRRRHGIDRSRGRVHLYTTSRGRHSIRKMYLKLIRHAEKSVFITNGYFLPDAWFRHELATAASRGVDVRLLLAGKSDVPAFQHATRRLYSSMLDHGIRVHEWNASVLHAKSAIIDGRWTVIGTYNLDWRSWRNNLELALLIEGKDVGEAMVKQFLSDLEQSPAVDGKQWESRSWFNRAREELFFRFRRIF